MIITLKRDGRLKKMQIKRMGVKKPPIEDILASVKEAIEEAIKTRSTRGIEISFEDLMGPIPKDYIPPTIAITPEAYLKMNAIVQEYTKDEIAWHGVVERSKDGLKYLIKDILVYPQLIAATTVDADEQEYPKWLMSQGALINQIRMQGHSHVNMGVVPSGVDEQYYTQMAEQVNDYYIFIIMNRRQELYIRFYDKENDVIVDKIPLHIWVKGQTLDTFIKNAKTLIKEKFKPIYTPPYAPKPLNPIVGKGDVDTKDILDKESYYAELQERQYYGYHRK